MIIDRMDFFNEVFSVNKQLIKTFFVKYQLIFRARVKSDFVDLGVVVQGCYEIILKIPRILP